MIQDRWRRITAAFHQALAHRLSSRDAFLNEALADSSATVRREVDRLLAAHQRADGFLCPRGHGEPRFERGARLGAYEIVGLLGAGGMGEVYRARDRVLDRDVALKCLHPSLASDPQRQELFAREARAVAALNHPHIVTLYGVEKHAGTVFLVMELVEGRTLDEMIQPGGLPEDAFFSVALALVSAVAAAHEKGVVHRDLKPGNVMVRSDGAIKVLDFGIAALHAPDAPSLDSPTTIQTQVGPIVGTPAYMSPEQAEGRRVDHRTDLFSLGLIFFELLAGHHPLHGETGGAPLRALSPGAPPIPPLGMRAPAGVAELIWKLLAHDPASRPQSARQLERDLQELAVRRQRQGKARSARYAALAAAAAVALLAIPVVWYVARRETAVETPALTVTVSRLTSDEGVETQPALSLDGRWLAYAKDGDIFLRTAGATSAANLTADLDGLAEDPAFSSDGSHLAFAVSNMATDSAGGIWLMDAGGGGKRRLTSRGFAPVWSPDDREIVFTTEPPRLNRPRRSQMLAADVKTGVTRVLSGPEDDALQPAFSPSGRRIAYFRQWIPGRPIVQNDLWTMSRDGRDRVALTDDASVESSPVWSADGRYVYFCSGRSGTRNVWRIAVDEATGRAAGTPEHVPTPARTASVALAADGVRFVYEAEDSSSNVQVLAFDPAAESIRGTPAPVTSGALSWADVDVTHDGRFLVWSTGGQQDIHVGRAGATGLTALAPDQALDRFARWSPDGQWIAFSSMKSSGNFEIHVMRLDGRDLRRVTFLERFAAFFPLWDPQGRRLAFTEAVAAGGRTYLIDVAEPWPAQLKPWLTPPADPDTRYRPWSWSADGKWIVAYSERGAGMIVYSAANGASRQVLDHGEKPRWMRDSRRVIYTHRGRLRLLDTMSGRSRELYALQGDAIADPALSADDRAIYFIRQRVQSDLWMGQLGTTPRNR